MGEGSGKKKHIILVHGACHGAWSWHKVTTLLRSAGYQVTAPDLAASGVDEQRFQDLRTFTDYTQPLLEVVASLPPGERVVLVGHSLGGMNIALAMDRFPEKIAAAVFVAAFMPDSVNSPSYVIDKVRRSAMICHCSHLCPGCNPNSHSCMPSAICLLHRQLKQEKTMSYWIDTQFGPSSFFLEDLVSVPPFSESGYGSVEKVYVVCAQDEGISEGFQRWMVENNPVKVVKEIEDADHMAMFSTPKQLFQCICDVVDASA
ncbi:hypothetical protein GW17_00056607 [Ensete ventricosum]|nr:hypothetical protein GW17_00056607 [Ensete ventricosum]